jgi:transcriptional regulator with XRE-family HTH domain
MRQYRGDLEVEQDASNIFGTRLAQVRERRGLSIADLAERTGLPRQTIARIERGTIKAPSVYTAALLAKALNADLNFLAGIYDEAGLAPADLILEDAPWHQSGRPDAEAGATALPQYTTAPPPTVAYLGI